MVPSVSAFCLVLCSWILTYSHATRMGTVAHDATPLSASSLALSIPRGGAWYFGKKTAARRYRQLLQDQVTLLDRQLRQSHEELTQLRRQLKTSQTLLHRSGSPAGRLTRITTTEATYSEKVKALAENQDLKKRIAFLSQEVSNLEKLRDELQTIIENQHAKMEQLELQLKNLGEANENLVQRAETEMERLKRDIEAKYQKQIVELTELMDRRVQEAAEYARQAALREMEAAVTQATVAEQKRSEKLLEEERRRSEAAVEREKAKMRKLAKALFEREKKLNTLDRDLVETATVKSSLGGLPTGKTMNSSYKVDTIRKF